MEKVDLDIFSTFNSVATDDFFDKLIVFYKDNYSTINVEELQLALHRNRIIKSSTKEELVKLTSLYIDGLPSIYESDFIEDNFNNNKELLKYINSNLFSFLRDELSIYKETNDFFKTKNRNSMFWRRKLYKLLIKGS